MSTFDEIIEYGPGGYDPTQPNDNEIDRRQVEVSTEVANERGVREKARQALAANRAYLAIPSPTAAQSREQVTLLTREVNGLIRFLLADFEDVSDT